MPVTQYLRRPAVRWDFYHKEAFANWRTPTAAELNTPLLGLNATCAIDEDSTTFSLGDSELDERYSYCDQSGQTRPVRFAPEASLGIFEDEDRAAAGVFNEAKKWFMFPDFEFWIVKRVGPQIKDSLATYGVNDRIKQMLVMTDNPVNELGGEDPALLTQSFLVRGQTNWNYRVAA